MTRLNLPDYSFKKKFAEGKEYIFDPQRNKYVLLTPEEWVRQNFVKFLIHERSYPGGRIVLEKTIKVNNLIRRCDILVYDDYFTPLLLVECKAPGVKISRSVFDQASNYNQLFNLGFLVVTNGLVHYCAQLDFAKRSIKFLNNIPHYSELLSHS